MPRSATGLNKEHKRLELALEAARLGEFEWDIVRDVVIVSPRMATITGQKAGETSAQGGAGLFPHVHPDDADVVRARQAKALATKDSRYEQQFRHRRPDDGREVWLHLAAAIERDAAGTPVAVFGVMDDVTERHQEEDQRHALMAEIDHRVKNVLAAIQALAVQTAKRTTSLDRFLPNFTGRLKALASANELLTAARWRGAAIDHLAAAELSALAPGQATWEGPELFLTPRAANALSLALHELTTNAVKFGALSVETGQVELRWRRLPNGGFELIWRESGGPAVQPPVRHGFGSTLLDRVTGRELNGETVVEYRPSGVYVQLRAGPAAVAPRPDMAPTAPVQPRPVEVAAAAAAVDQRALRGRRILIVEDAVLLALELEVGLTEAGGEVVGPAYELDEAMSLVDLPLDAAVLDANLNGRSVIPVAEALAARRVPFVFATGYGEAGGAPGGFDAPVIRKPYDVTQVSAALAQLLQRESG